MEKQPEIVQLPWDQPILSTAVDWLISSQPEGVVDLSDSCVLLPTQQAGRRLREALAWACNARGGVFPPRTGTPFQLLQSTAPNVAPEVVCIGQWTQVLGGPLAGKCSALFPALPAKRDFAWRRKMAEALQDLRDTLMEGGWTCESVYESPHCDEESLRWRDLAFLEREYIQRLDQQGFIDSHTAQLEASNEPPGGNARRVVLMGVTDAHPVICQALKCLLGKGVKVQVVIFGPEGGFDEWGRPYPEFWNDRDLPVRDHELVPAYDERAQAEAVVERVKPYRKQVHDRVAVGIADPAVLPHLERRLADAGISAFNPDGQLLRHTSPFIFLKTLQSLLQNESFAQAAAFLRLPDAWGWAAAGDDQLTPTRLLAGLDELHKKHLPATLEDASRLHFEGEHIANRIMARDALRRLSAQLKGMMKLPLSRGLREFLRAVFEHREFCEGNAADKPYLATARSFIERLHEWESVMNDSVDVEPAEILGLLLDIVGEEPIFPERSGDAVDIQGWLELAWEDAPHLIVAGCNEGHLPKSIVGDRFLPERLRARLGLATNAERLARDVYLMELLHASRSRDGQVDLILGRQRASGDPLRPSRVLLRCADSDLPVRVQHLFQDLPPPEQPPAWSLPWSLQPRAVPPLEKLSVTAFRSYLSCPFRFFLKHALRMESVDTSKRELDALDFGLLVHKVVEDFGRDESARDMAEVGAINQYFVDRLQAIVEELYGGTPPLPLQIQHQIAARRLYSAAIVQAQEFASGWRIIDTERAFEGQLHGMTVRGRIDRIERNETTGALRVLDYKTSAKAKSPLQVHTGPCRDDSPDYATFYATVKDKEKALRWLDLQLPLYAWALQDEEGAELQLGYFHLPNIGADTGIQLLDPYTPNMHEAAMSCAKAIVERVQAGTFWPASDALRFDEFQDILFGSATESASQPQWEGEA